MIRAVVVLAALSLVGCAGLAPVAPTTPASWVLEGRIAVRSSEDGSSASLRWEQRDAAVLVQLSGPAGRGATELSGSPEYIRIRRAGVDEVIEGPPPQVMSRQLGWFVPLEYASAWLQGEPAPDAEVDVYERDSRGRVLHFEQAGFELRVEWGETRPVRVALQRDDLKVMVRIRRWSTSSA